MIKDSNKYNYQSLLYLLLLLSGFLKGLTLFNFGYKIEFVKIAVILAVFDIVIQLIRRRIHFSYSFAYLLGIIILFYVWIIFTSIYSPSEVYKYDKIFSFLPNIIFFIYPMFIKLINFNLLIKWYTIILLPLAVLLIYLKSITWTGDIESPELFIGNLFDYLSLGLHLGILFLLLNHFNKNKWIQITVFALLIASSARAPLLITVFLTLIINYKFILKFKFIKTIFNIKLIGFVVVLYLFFSTQILPFFSNSHSRLISLFSSSDSSTSSRIDMFEYSFNQPFESLTTFFMGNGIGSFGIIYMGIDQRAYPHNIILETFFELGFIGLFLGFLIILLILNNFNIKKNIFSLLLLFVFLNAMKSSNLTDLWILFSFIGASSIANSKMQIYNSIK